jgi:low affinity Fe/Cu permease
VNLDLAMHRLYSLRFRDVATAYGHVRHFWLKVVGAVLVLLAGWLLGDIQTTMLAYTTFLTVTTDLGTIIVQHSGADDTCQIKQQLSELGRAVPGAEDVIPDEGA